MAVDTLEGRWGEFEADFSVHPLNTWEFYAPRSGWLNTPDAIYKLFVRRRPQKRTENPRWWMFEDDIILVEPHYPRWYYEQVKPVRTISGPLSHLMLLQPERHVYMRPALEVAMNFIHHRIASDDELRLRAERMRPDPSPRERAELAVLEEMVRRQREA